MFLMREVLYCKPGKVRSLVDKFKALGVVLDDMGYQPFRTGLIHTLTLIKNADGGNKRISVEGLIRSGSDYRMADITKDEIIEDFVKHYTQRVQR